MTYSGTQLLTPMRPVRRVLVAHDTRSTTCDALIETLGETLGNVEIAESSSADQAVLLLAHERWEACLVCLDLPPAPSAGVRLAEVAAAARGRDVAPVLLVTRSLRWLPAGAVDVATLPWIPPDASAGELGRAIDAATRRAREHRAGFPEPRESDVVLRSSISSRQRRSAR